MKKKKWKILLCVLLSLFIVKMGVNCFFPYLSFSTTHSSGTIICVLTDTDDVSLRKYVDTGFLLRRSGRFYLQWRNNGEHTVYTAELAGGRDLHEIQTFSLITMGPFSWLKSGDSIILSEISQEEKLYFFNLLHMKDAIASSMETTAFDEMCIANAVVPDGARTDRFLDAVGGPDYRVSVEQIADKLIDYHTEYRTETLKETLKKKLYDCDEVWCYEISRDYYYNRRYFIAIAIKDGVIQDGYTYEEPIGDSTD